MLKWTINARRTEGERAATRRSMPNGRGLRRRSTSATQRRRSGLQRRRSADDKENRCTSTPVKSHEEHHGALRDLSNITPTPKKSKKKKCLATHDTSAFFRPFETVDSHIGAALDVDVCEMRKRRLPDAPTLPTLDVEYSPYRTTDCLLLHSTKKCRTEHVDDFLHQITYGEDEDSFDIKVSPLVKKFVDLRFGKKGCDTNNSSFINDLSLDKIVDAIIDKSIDSSHTNTSTLVHCDTEIQRQNELNQTHEENLLNIVQEQKHHRLSPSTDSGFRSTSTEQSHRLDEHYVCKCRTGSSARTLDKTIIDVNGTYNERCVDVDVTTRKRSSTTVFESNPPKRQLLDQSLGDNINFTLRRQRCIRRRRIEDERPKKNTKCQPKVADQSVTEDLFYSFENFDRSTPIKDETTVVKTPTIEGSRRFRRCLLFESPTSLSESASNSHVSIGEVRGSVDLSIRLEGEELVVDVVRCKDLYRTNGKQINAYVKVALADRSKDARPRPTDALLHRTAVHADSHHPTFNRTFRFPYAADRRRLHIEVWHRERATRTSEFLGCMSFDPKHAYIKDIVGMYRLLPQSTGRCQNVPITVDEREEAGSTMCESQSSVDEMMSLDELENDLKKTTSKTVLSEQQKHADENLFLRYLELDPIDGPEAIPAATQRKATGNKNGRTPFTQTKKLVRAPRSGFGFSVVWTHPPRIERVEKGLPADKAGILPGDYIIFVDKHNVVMMPEIDILNLIRSYGSQLTLEIFRRNTSRNGSVPSVRRLNSTGTCGSTTGLPVASNLIQRRPSTVCSTNTTSVDYNRRKLHLPQVTFSAEKTTSNDEENRKKVMYQLINKEQQYATGLQFAITRFVSALAERRDLITPAEHKILFQNAEELLRITEDILDNILQEDNELHLNILLRTYYSKLNEITGAYKRYCSGIKRADYLLMNKTKNNNSEFVRFVQTPAIPRRRPDLTTFIHKPLEHYRDILRLLTNIQTNVKTTHDDLHIINKIVHELQTTYREITVDAGLMEPMGEGRPLLTVQDLENRLVFTKCKPFVLNKPGRQWIFGGDLGRVEGRNVRQYWTLLFNDLLVFAKVSRDRVLFVMEEPLPLNHVTDMIFNVRKKDTEFRITTMPGGRSATSPTVHCGPDLSRTPKKNASKRTVVLRAPTPELKAVWQNLLQRQIFHVNSGMDGSSFSSPLESPEAPITSSVATLQSAESFSYRRQTPQNLSENTEIQKQIDAIIEHKCKQLSKANSGKGSTLHLEKWIRGQLEYETHSEDPLDPLPELWTEEMLRKRSEELQLIDGHGNITYRTETFAEFKCEEQFTPDHDQSPSKSTESQVTVRSSPLMSETVQVCRQCHKNCLNSNKNIRSKDVNDNKDDWQPFLLMGLSAINPAASLVKLDPFSAPVPQISVAPPTPESSKTTNSEMKFRDVCNCALEINAVDNDVSPDDSPQTEEHPYHSLSSSNLTLKRYGTVSSLEKIANEENEEEEIEEEEEEDEENSDCNSSLENDDMREGHDNEAFYQSSIRNWTAKAGSYVAEKMAFFEKLGEDYRNSSSFFERYLKTSNTPLNGEDFQEEETSGGTSGEEIWGTPTSGGELEDPLSSSNHEGKLSPNDETLSSENGDDTELMMDELLMTPPISGAIIRGLLPRRTLEPLIEEDYTESNSSSSSATPTETSVSPEQGNDPGDAADTCSAVVDAITDVHKDTTIESTQSVVIKSNQMTKIHRSESYRRIVEAAEDQEANINFFDRFKPTAKFINIERVPRPKSVKIFEFFNVRRERRVHQTYPEGRHLIKLFSKEGTISDEVPTSYSQKPTSLKRLKDKQLDRRFWKQLSKRRENRNSNSPI